MTKLSFKDYRSPNFFTGVSLGRIDGFESYNFFGYNPAVDTVYESIWPVGGSYPFDATPGQCTVASTSASDVGTLFVRYVSGDWTPQSKTITLTGTTPVVLDTDVRHVYSAYVVDPALVGTVTFTLDGQTVTQILPNTNNSLNSISVIPKSHIGLLFRGKVSTGRGKDLTIEFRTRTNGYAFLTQHMAQVYENSYDFAFDCPLVIPEKTILEVRGKTSSGTVEAMVSYNIILVEMGKL